MLYGYRYLCFIADIRRGDINKDIVEVVETNHESLNHELDRPLPKRKKKLKSNWINER